MRGLWAARDVRAGFDAYLRGCRPGAIVAAEAAETARRGRGERACCWTT